VTEHWKQGDAIILRMVLPNGHIGGVLPVTVVRDDDDLVALYLAPGTTCNWRPEPAWPLPGTPEGWECDAISGTRGLLP
jgi:hypothetical protein